MASNTEEFITFKSKEFGGRLLDEIELKDLPAPILDYFHLIH